MKLRHLIYLAFHLFYVSPCDDSPEADHRKFVKSYTHCTDKNRRCTLVEFSFHCSSSTVEECHVQPRHIYQSPLQVLAESANENIPDDEKPPYEMIALVWFATLFSKVDPALDKPADSYINSSPRPLSTLTSHSPLVSLSEDVSSSPTPVTRANVQDMKDPTIYETHIHASSDETNALEAASSFVDESLYTVQPDGSVVSDDSPSTSDNASEDSSPASPIALLPQMLDPIPVLGPFLSAMIAPSMESFLNKPHEGTVWERLVSNVFPHENKASEIVEPTASPDIPFHSGGAPPPREGPPLMRRKLAERSYVPLAGAMDEDPWLSQAFETKAVEYVLSALRTPLTVAALTVAPHDEVQEVYEETQRKQESKKSANSRDGNALMRAIEMFSPLKGRIKKPNLVTPDLPPMWPNAPSNNGEASASPPRLLVESPLEQQPPPFPILPLQGGLPFLNTIPQLQPPTVILPQVSEIGTDARGNRADPTTTDMLPWIPLDSIAGELPVWLGEALIGPFALLFEDLVRVAQDAFIRLQVIIDAVGSEPVPVASENLQTFLEKMSQAFRTSLAGNEADALKSLAVTIQELPVLPELAKDKIVTPEGSSVAQVLSQFDSLLENMKHHTGRLLAPGSISASPSRAEEKTVENKPHHTGRLLAAASTSTSPSQAKEKTQDLSESREKMSSKSILGPDEFKYLASSAGNDNRPTTSDLLPWRPLDAIVGEYPKYLKDKGNDLIESITDKFKEGGSQIAHMLFPFLPSQKSDSSSASSTSRPQHQEAVYPQQIPSVSTVQKRESDIWGYKNERSVPEPHEFVDGDDARNIRWVSNDGHPDKKDVKDRVADAFSGALDIWPGLLKQFLSGDSEGHADEKPLHGDTSKKNVGHKLFHTLDARDAEHIVLEEARRSKAAESISDPKVEDGANTAKRSEAVTSEIESAECDQTCRVTVEVPCDKLVSFQETLQRFLVEKHSSPSRRPEQTPIYDLGSGALPPLDPSLWTSLASSPSTNPMEDLLRLMPPAYIPTIDAWLDDTRQTLAKHAGEIEVPPFLDPWLADDDPALNLIDLVGQLAAARSTDLRTPLAAVEEARARQEQAYNEWLARTQTIDLPSLNDILEKIQPPPLAFPMSISSSNEPSSPDALLNSLLSTLLQLPQPPTFALSEREVDPASVLQQLGLYAQNLNTYWQDLARALERIPVTQLPILGGVPVNERAFDPRAPLGKPSSGLSVGSASGSPLPYANSDALPPMPYPVDNPIVPAPYMDAVVPSDSIYGQSLPLTPDSNHQPPFILPEYAEGFEPDAAIDAELADTEQKARGPNVDLIKDVILGGLEELNKIGSSEYSKALAKLREARKSRGSNQIASAPSVAAKESEVHEGLEVVGDGEESVRGRRRLFGDKVVVTSDHNVVQFSDNGAEDAAKQLEGILSSILDTFGVPSPFAHLPSDPRELLNSFLDGNHEMRELPATSDELKQRAQQGASNLIQGLAETLLSDGPRFPTVSPDEAADYNEIQYGRGHAGVEPLNRVPATVANPRDSTHFVRPTGHQRNSYSNHFVGGYYNW